MRLLVAALADYANVTADGKLNVFGVFDTIFVPKDKFPAVHLLAVVALRLMFEYEDGDAHHILAVTLVNQDGREFARSEGAIDIPKIEPGNRAVVNQVLVLHQLRFDHPAKLAVAIRWDGDEKQRLPLDVVSAPDTP